MSATWTEDDPGVGDPWALRGLARQFARTADEGQLAQARLGRLAGQWGQQGWTGKAVRAFQSRLDRLPAHLQKLTDSYQAAADATLTYARAVEDIAEQTSLVKGRLALAEQDHAAAVAAQAALRPELALPTAGIDPLLIARQRAAEDAITQAADQLRLQTRELGLLAEERRAADQRMLSALRESSHVGMHNASGWSHAWQHVSTDVKHWTDNTLHAVDDAIDTAVNVGRYYWQHPDQARDAALDVAEIIGGAALDGLAFTGGGAAIAATGGAATPLVVPAVGAAVIATTDLMLNATNDLNHNLNEALADSKPDDSSASIGNDADVGTYPDKASARRALDEQFADGCNTFFKAATGKCRDYMVSKLPDGGYLLQFFAPANNEGYGKLYCRILDSNGQRAEEFRDTMGPSGLIERKWTYGEPR